MSRLFARASGWQSAVAVAALALVVGVTTAVFSIISGAIFRPLPIKDIQTIGNITFTSDGTISARGFTTADISRLNGLTAGLVTSIVGVDVEQSALAVGDTALDLMAENFSGPYFDTFSVPMLLGRSPGPHSNAADACCVAAISERLWRTRFASDRGIVGTVVTVAGTHFTVVGVVSASFRGVLLPQLVSVDVWIPREQLPVNAQHTMQVFAKLAANRSFSEIRSGVRSFGVGFDQGEPQAGLDLQPAWRGMVPPPLIAIGAAIAGVSIAVCIVVLLLGVATVSNVVRVGILSRRQEFSLRMALGADSTDLARQGRRESMAVTVPGCILGAAGSVLLLKLLNTTVVLPASGAFVPRIDASPDIRVLFFVVLTFAGLTLLLARSQVRAMWTDPSVLASGARQGGAGEHGASLKPVTMQLAVATTLLLVSVLFLRNVDHLHRVAAFASDHVVVARAQAPTASAPAGLPLWSPAFRTGLGANVRVGIATSLPLPSRFGLQRAGVTPGARGGRSFSTHVVGVSEDFLSVLGLPVVRGQGLSRSPSDRVDQAVVDETLAEALWPDGNPIGQRLWVADTDRSKIVVGVARAPVGRSGPSSLRSFLFVPIETVSARSLEVLLTGPYSDRDLAGALRAYVKRADPSTVVSEAQPLRDYSDPYARIAAASSMPAAMAGALALALTLASLYALTSQSVAARVNEFGVRAALGASRWSLCGLILQQCLGVIVRGSALGALGALGCALFLPTEFVQGLGWVDIFFLAVLPVAAFLSCMLAALPAAFRAGRADPLALIRS